MTLLIKEIEKVLPGAWEGIGIWPPKFWQIYLAQDRNLRNCFLTFISIYGQLKYVPNVNKYERNLLLIKIFSSKHFRLPFEFFTLTSFVLRSRVKQLIVRLLRSWYFFRMFQSNCSCQLGNFNSKPRVINGHKYWQFAQILEIHLYIL